jgi:4-alpha-glucanotransferase
MFAIAPLQDFLSLDTEARMNFPENLPETGIGEWSERLSPQLSSSIHDSTGCTAAWQR